MNTKAIWLSLAVAMLLLGSTFESAAQQSSNAPLNPPANNDLSPGTTICATLATTIDAKNANPGDAIAAHVTLPVLAKGKVFLPNDAKITGHIVSAKKRSRGGAESEVAIVFERAVLKDGTVVPLSLTVQAIGRPALTAAEIADQDLSNPAPINARRGQPSTSTGRQTTMNTPATAREVPQPGPPDVDEPEPEHPALDTGSHGAVGLPNLRLIESSDATSGSVVRAMKKNVKLESGMEMILRVVDARSDGSKPKS